MMNIFETLVYSTVLILGQQEHYLQGSTRSSSSVPLLLLASDHHDDDDDNDTDDDDYSEASEASSVNNNDGDNNGKNNSINVSTKDENTTSSSSKSHQPINKGGSWFDIGNFFWNRSAVLDDDDAELERRAEEIAIEEASDDDDDDEYEYKPIPINTTTTIKTIKKQRRKRRLAPPTKYQIRALFHLWKCSLTSGDIDGSISKRYTTNAVLNPMNMNLDDDEDHSNNFESYMPLTNSKSIQNYYNEFISMYRPKDCRILRGRVTIGEQISDDDTSSTYAQDNGIIEMITFSGQIIHARYTFIYVRNSDATNRKDGSSRNSRWKIVNHTFSKIDTNTTTTTIPASAISGTTKTNKDIKNDVIMSPARSTPPQSLSSSSPSPPIMSVSQSLLPLSMTTAKATYTPPTTMSRRRPSQIDYLVNILTRSQSITQKDLLLFSTTTTT